MQLSDAMPNVQIQRLYKAQFRKIDFKALTTVMALQQTTQVVTIMFTLETFVEKVDSHFTRFLKQACSHWKHSYHCKGKKSDSK